MKIMLLSPPERDPYAPMLALPSLTAFLRQNGFSVIQKDIGVDLLDYYYQSSSLKELYKYCKERFEILDSKKELNWIEQVEYARYLSKNFNRFPYYIDNIERIKKNVKCVSNYRVNCDGTPILEEDWLVLDEIRNFIFQPSRKYVPFKIRELSTKALFSAIENKDELFYVRYYENYVLQSIILENPNVVGLSITFPDQVIPGLLLAYLIKKAIPQTHITIGGSHFSLLKDELAYMPELFTFIDSFVINEGEYSLLNLAQAISIGGELENIPNLVYKSVQEKIVITKLEKISNLNDLPCPDFTGLPLDKYLVGKLVIPYAFSRGCYWGKCAFCNFHHSNLNYRIKCEDKLISDLVHLSSYYNTNLFYFTHEADPPIRMKKVFKKIKEANLNLKYFTFCRFDSTIDLELLRLLKDTGCKHLYFGLESGNTRVNALINKGIDYAVAKRIIEEASSMKLHTSVSSIKCFPTETTEELMDTFKFYENIVKPNQFCSGNTHIYRLAKGSPVEKNYKDFGIREIHYNSSGNMNTVLNFKMNEEENNKTSYERKKELKRNQAKVHSEHSNTHDYAFLMFAELNEEEFLKWLEANRNDHFYTMNESSTIYDDVNFRQKKISLANKVEIKEINFPLNNIKQAINKRANIIYKQFYDDGIPLDEIARKSNFEKEKISQKRQLFIYSENSGDHVLINHDWKKVIENMRTKRDMETLLDESFSSTLKKFSKNQLLDSTEEIIKTFAEKKFIVIE